ncbi:hypothetical protein [Bifidobacterium aquikefiricola]|uniref:Transposase n=1 Tax=Bifidobacterium aquikefiricola TaxID=3059038 RepID=A0AB39U7N8_9BIFI
MTVATFIARVVIAIIVWSADEAEHSIGINKACPDITDVLLSNWKPGVCGSNTIRDINREGKNIRATSAARYIARSKVSSTMKMTHRSLGTGAEALNTAWR